MPPGQSDPAYSIAQLREYLAQLMPKHVRNFERILPLIELGLARKHSNDPDLQLQAEDKDAFEQFTPAYQLLDALDSQSAKWSSWVPDLVPEIALVRAYSREYRISFQACLKRAINGGVISPAFVGVSTEWQEMRSVLAKTLPYTDPVLDTLIESGQTDFYGHPIKRSNRKRTKNEFRIMLHGFNALGRFMTSIGVSDPRNVRPEHICGREGSWYEHLKRGKPHDMKVYYCAKAACELLRHILPDAPMIPWPSPNETRAYGLKRGERPEHLEAMLKEIDTLGTLDDGTLRNIRTNTYRMLGYYQKFHGYDIGALSQEIDGPQDLGWLLLSPYPPSGRQRPPEPAKEVQLICTDPVYRLGILDRMADAVRVSSDHGPCRTNPFQQGYVEWCKERGTFTMALTALTSFEIAAQHYLQSINKSQLKCSKDLRFQVRKAKKRAPAKPWQRRKEILARDPDAWKKLVRARERMTAHTLQWRQQMEATEDLEKRRDRERHYAVALRDELVINMLLCFQLRNTNILLMRLGAELNEKQYRISIPGHRAKAHLRINKRFHDRGAFADLKTLLDLYLNEGRPALLPVGSDSQYLLLPFPGEKNCMDQAGHIRLSTTAMNRIVRNACDRYFRDLLPDDLDHLTAHLFRDLFANVGYRDKNGGDVIAAQGLANNVETLRQRYLGMDRTSDEEVRNFIQGMDITDVAANESERRREYKQQIESLIAKGSSNIAEYMRLHDKYR